MTMLLPSKTGAISLLKKGSSIVLLGAFLVGCNEGAGQDADSEEGGFLNSMFSSQNAQEEIRAEQEKNDDAAAQRAHEERLAAGENALALERAKLEAESAENVQSLRDRNQAAQGEFDVEKERVRADGRVKQAQARSQGQLMSTGLGALGQLTGSVMEARAQANAQESRNEALVTRERARGEAQLAVVNAQSEAALKEQEMELKYQAVQERIDRYRENDEEEKARGLENARDLKLQELGKVSQHAEALEKRRDRLESFHDTGTVMITGTDAANEFHAHAKRSGFSVSRTNDGETVTFTHDSSLINRDIFNSSMSNLNEAIRVNKELESTLRALADSESVSDDLYDAIKERVPGGLEAIEAIADSEHAILCEDEKLNSRTCEEIYANLSSTSEEETNNLRVGLLGLVEAKPDNPDSKEKFLTRYEALNENLQDQIDSTPERAIKNRLINFQSLVQLTAIAKLKDPTLTLKTDITIEELAGDLIAKVDVAGGIDTFTEGTGVEVAFNNYDVWANKYVEHRKDKKRVGDLLKNLREQE